MPDNSGVIQNLIPSEPHLIDLLNLHQKQIQLNLNAIHIGTIQSFNSATQTASVTINYKKTFFQFNDQTGVYETQLENYPVIGEAPVVMLRGGTSFLSFPISPGDECVVLFNDRDLDNWYAGGTGSPNNTGRLHSFADALVLIGVRSLPNVLPSYDNTRVILNGPGTAQIGIGPALIKISNATFDLGSLLQNLCSALENLTTALTTNAATFIAVTGAPGSPSPLNPVIAAAIVSVQTSLTLVGTQLGELLE